MNRAARLEDASASAMEVGSGCADAAGAESKPRGGGTGEAAGGGCKCGAGGGSGDLLDSAYGSTETNSNVACPLMIITKDSTNTWAVDSHRIPQEFYNVKVGDCKALRRSSL